MPLSNVGDPQYGEKKRLENTQVVDSRQQASQPAAAQPPSPGLSAAGQPPIYEDEDEYLSPFAAISNRKIANALFRLTVLGNIASHDGSHPDLIELYKAAEQDLKEVTGEGEEVKNDSNKSKTTKEEKK